MFVYYIFLAICVWLGRILFISCSVHSTLSASSHQNHTWTQSVCLCNSCSEILGCRSHWIAKNVHSFWKTCCIKSDGTLVPCNLVPTYALHLRSMFGVLIAMYRHFVVILNVSDEPVFNLTSTCKHCGRSAGVTDWGIWAVSILFSFWSIK